MNSVNIIGRLTKDPELNYLPGSGTAVANFDIAVNDYVNKAKVTYFFRVVTWGKVAENVCQYKKKGDEVGVTGKLVTDKFTNKEGKAVTVTKINASDVTFIGSSNSNADNKNPGSYEDSMTPDSDENSPW